MDATVGSRHPGREGGAAATDRDPRRSDPRPAAITFLTTEHFALQGARAATIAESTGRANMFLGAVSGGLVALTGGTPAFLGRFPQLVINVHPSLLPAFPGIRAVEQALEYGVKVFGVTVHFVDEGVDSGPVILQRALELPDVTDPDEIRDRLRGRPVRSWSRSP